MAKRFTETNKWDDPFFIDLDVKYKMLWLFMLDKCDHAGMFQFSKRLVDFHLCSSYDESDVLIVFGSRIIVLESGKWFINRFIKYQYGDLNENNRVHKSVIDILHKEGASKTLARVILGASKELVSPMLGSSKGHASSMLGAKDKDKDKGKTNTKTNTKNKNKEKITKRKNFKKPSLDEIKEYCLERNNKVDPQKFLDHYESNGWKVGRTNMADWTAAVRTWERNGAMGSVSVSGGRKEVYQDRIKTGEQHGW
jgi:hypothetical protein